MSELQGLNYIDGNGFYKGTIENNFYNEKTDEYVIDYKSPKLYYYVLKMNKDEYESFKYYALVRSERYNIIKSKNITDLYHFSPIENIDSILKCGLCSRDFAKLVGVNVIFTDQNRYDGELNKISTSISFPNYKMKYSLELHENFKFVIYSINPRILLAKLDTQFYHTNAANAIFSNIDKKALTTNEAFLSMFDQYNRDPFIPDNYTTDPQAEVLIDTCIPSSYIEKVIVDEDNIEIEDLCEQKKLVYKKDINLNRGRQDWRRWQNGN